MKPIVNVSKSDVEHIDNVVNIYLYLYKFTYVASYLSLIVSSSSSYPVFTVLALELINAMKYINVGQPPNL